MKNLWNRLYTNQEVDIGIRIFNIVNSICGIGMLLFCLIVIRFFNSLTVLYLNLGVAVMFFITMLEANRTGKTDSCAVTMSLFLNLFCLPYTFLSYGRYICVVPMLFIFGLLYTILVLDMKKALILGISEMFLQIVFLKYSLSIVPSGMENISVSERNDMYYAAMAAVIITGICSGAAVRFRYLFYKKEQETAQKLQVGAMDAYIEKDMFLINMSHEIRTPMNAIVGTVDLLLDQDIDSHVKDNVYNILNSCNALLSITNELMDLSKSESSEIVVHVMQYDIHDLFMDIINMITVRLMESELEFYVDINRDIPRFMLGDSSKLRQIFINLLNNAIKYTQNGSIILRVDYQKIDDKNIELLVDVEDTGVGIREEEMPKLFERYERANEDENHKIEGTGLGLKICKELLTEMKGEISVKSKYREGSVFSFRVPQKFERTDVIAEIKNSSSYSVLVYESDEKHSDYFSKLMSSFDIATDCAKNRQEFERLLSSKQHTHLFIASELFESCQRLLSTRLSSEEIIVMANIEDSIDSSKCNIVLTRPVHVLNIAGVFNHEDNSHVRQILKKGGFSIPKARIMVVDDNYTNLNVASALLKKYEADVVTALSGKDCIRLLEETEVDMIFLDYMMPEMNGIDTLKMIRAVSNERYKDLPVVALTANVVSGAREMFLEAGFNDFISKPIAVDKMEKSLRTFLPKELIVTK